MRKIKFSIPITLDGYIEGPQQELDWVIADDELHDFASQLIENADLLVYGRVTYQLMVDYWPTATTDGNATEAMKRFANTLNPKRKIVYSTTLKQVNWNTQLVKRFEPEKIRQLKSEAGSDILLSGGAAMAKEFFKHGLVDEYIPIIQPVAIGNGKALFNGIQDLPGLDLLWIQRFHSGAVALCYRVKGKAAAQ